DCANFANIKVHIGKLAAFRQRDWRSRVGIRHSGIVKRGVGVLRVRNQRAALDGARNGRSRRRSQQQIAPGRQTKDAVVTAIVRSGSGNRDQLAMTAGVAEAQHLNSYALERFAVFIDQAAGDGPKRRDAKSKLAKLLARRKSEHSSFTSG